MADGVMTQHMLLQSANPSSSLDNIVFMRVGIESDCVFSKAVSWNFADSSTPVWKVFPQGEEMDFLADQARDVILEGGSLRETALGRLLHEAVMRQQRFCLFWALDFKDLPSPKSESELFQLLTEQLSSDGSWNWELYAWWGGST